MRDIVNAVLMQDDKVLLVRRSPHRLAYPGLWSFPGGHVEQDETLMERLSEKCARKSGLIPTSFSFLVSIPDPNASENDPATYYFYAVFAWTGGEPTLLGDEHTELVLDASRYRSP